MQKSISERSSPRREGSAHEWRRSLVAVSVLWAPAASLMVLGVTEHPRTGNSSVLCKYQVSWKKAFYFFVYSWWL